MNQYPTHLRPPCPVQGPGCLGSIRVRGAKACYGCSRLSSQPAPVAPTDLHGAVMGALKKGPATLEALAGVCASSQGQILDVLIALKDDGANLHQFGERWSIEKVAAPTGRTFEYIGRPDSTYVFGCASDQHLGSKYERLDVLNDLYDWFEAEGADRVFNSGNWIDGEDEKNRHDLAVHGLEPQLDYAVKTYPIRPGLKTYAVWGEDHEGWFARRESINIGRFFERKMLDAGRTDWVDLGFMEGNIDLVHPTTGARTSLLVMHPGGGTSYALSYRAQKLVESLQGGEKPSVILIGHYHKLSVNLIRGVWAIQVGCSQDQTPFMRKIPTEPHVGGVLVKLTQDPETGAITGCRAEMRQYFNRAYYNDRWSKSGPAVLPDRGFMRDDKIDIEQNGGLDGAEVSDTSPEPDDEPMRARGRAGEQSGRRTPRTSGADPRTVRRRRTPEV